MGDCPPPPRNSYRSIFISVPGPPKDVTVSISDEEATVKVQWNTPDKPNGKLTNYEIYWRPISKQRRYNWTSKIVKAHVLNDKISNLNASLRYSVKILAKNRAGEGKFSKPVTFVGGKLHQNVKMLPPPPPPPRKETSGFHFSPHK